ncbi:GIY-YIG catalytic domain protein [Blastochloris viridis]|nr:GIY-YIG catalytic domain protein [Blastochloris viridis]
MLASKPNGTLYIGVTRDVIRRVHQHRTKAVPGFTAKYGVTRLVYVETFDGPESAIGAFSAKVGTGFAEENATNQSQSREKQLKGWNRAWKIRLIEQANPSWRDLFEELAG